ncbi:ribonuclease H-like domain-containing protein [Thermosulfurimonas marina]|uniref:ribonuclease H-like domain-containing protein n=1 Tax=Thermosulfurimonas marina TaxID=2047767 RepID=UPI00144A7F16|nr:ribonuclease H-like domain-containing protein [Thermosulfurimonas marina]
MRLDPWCRSLPEPLAREVLRAPERHILFLDIETEGLSKERNGLTVLGTMVGRCYRAFVAGHNLEKGPAYLGRFPVWVTFGGSTFDLPFLRAHFPHLPAPALHIDLCRVFRHLGYRGGLKKLEIRFGLSRKTQGLTGYHAVRLWQRWQRERDRRALRLLLHYNREDVANLRPLLEIAAAKLGREAPLG